MFGIKIVDVIDYLEFLLNGCVEFYTEVLLLKFFILGHCVVRDNMVYSAE